MNKLFLVIVICFCGSGILLAQTSTGGNTIGGPAGAGTTSSTEAGASAGTSPNSSVQTPTAPTHSGLPAGPVMRGLPASTVHDAVPGMTNRFQAESQAVTNGSVGWGLQDRSRFSYGSPVQVTAARLQREIEQILPLLETYYSRSGWPAQTAQSTATARDRGDIDIREAPGLEDTRLDNSTADREGSGSNLSANSSRNTSGRASVNYSTSAAANVADSQSQGLALPGTAQVGTPANVPPNITVPGDQNLTPTGERGPRNYGEMLQGGTQLAPWELQRLQQDLERLLPQLRRLTVSPTNNYPR